MFEIVRILTDSVSGIKEDQARELDVDVITLSVIQNGVSQDETEMDLDDFNSRLASFTDELPTSSQPEVGAFLKYFEKCAEAGDSVVGIFISNKLSGTLDAALQSVEMVREKFSDFKCTIINSLASCGPELFPILKAVESRDSGATHDVVAMQATQVVKRSRIMFLPEDLRFLVLGGRLNQPAAFVASKLKIFPIISTVDGKAVSIHKVRTRAKSIDKMFSIFEEDAKNHGLRNVIVQYAGEKTEALFALKKRVESLVKRSVDLISVSPVVSVHVGPSIGIAYECCEEISGTITSKSTEIAYSY